MVEKKRIFLRFESVDYKCVSSSTTMIKLQNSFKLIYKFINCFEKMTYKNLVLQSLKVYPNQLLNALKKNIKRNWSEWIRKLCFYFCQYIVFFFSEVLDLKKGRKYQLYQDILILSGTPNKKNIGLKLMVSVVFEI